MELLVFWSYRQTQGFTENVLSSEYFGKILFSNYEELWSKIAGGHSPFSVTLSERSSSVEQLSSAFGPNHGIGIEIDV